MGPDIGKCSPGENYHGLWEVPLYQAQLKGEVYGVGSEPSCSTACAGGADAHAVCRCCCGSC